jgi:ribosomal protein L34E
LGEDVQKIAKKGQHWLKCEKSGDRLSGELRQTENYSPRCNLLRSPKLWLGEDVRKIAKKRQHWLKCEKSGDELSGELQ